MKNSVFVSILFIVGILFMLGGSEDEGGGCQCNVSTAQISEAKICTSLTAKLCDQDNPELESSTKTIYVSCRLKYAVEDTNVKFTWLYYGKTKIEIDNVVFNTGKNMGNLELHSSLSQPTNGWPKGAYEVVIQVQTDNAKPLIKQFNIK